MRSAASPAIVSAGGRRSSVNLLVFAVLTVAVSLVDNLAVLGLLRFLAGLGFGGTVPNAAALTSEYVPLRHRPLAITLTIVCIPLGGTLGALFASQVLPAFGWRMLFTIAGLLPLVVALVLLIVVAGVTSISRAAASSMGRAHTVASAIRPPVNVDTVFEAPVEHAAGTTVADRALLT